MQQADALVALGHDYLSKAFMASFILMPDACFNGVSQGEKVGDFVVGNIKLKNQLGMNE